MLHLDDPIRFVTIGMLTIGPYAWWSLRYYRIFTVLSCLSESQIDRESEKHSFYEKILVLRKWA